MLTDEDDTLIFPFSPPESEVLQDQETQTCNFSLQSRFLQESIQRSLHGFNAYRSQDPWSVEALIKLASELQGVDPSELDDRQQSAVLKK